MELPKRKRYGVSCPDCSLTKWFENQLEAELALVVFFYDIGKNLVDSPAGLAIGFGKFEHICKKD